MPLTQQIVRVRDVMSSPVVTVEPFDSLRDVIDTFYTRGVSGAPVVAAGEVVGVISVSDILDFLASTPPVPSDRSDFAEWGEIETTEEEEEGEDSIAFYTDYWEDAGAEVFDRFATPDSPEWDLLREHTAGSLMTRKLEHVLPCTPVVAAAQKLLDAGVHRLLVMTDGQLEGILSALDFVRLVAAGALKEET